MLHIFARIAIDTLAAIGLASVTTYGFFMFCIWRMGKRADYDNREIEYR